MATQYYLHCHVSTTLSLPPHVHSSLMIFVDDCVLIFDLTGNYINYVWIVSVVNSYDSSVSVYSCSFILENKSCSGSTFQNVKLNSEQLLLVEQLVSRTEILVIILPPPPPPTTTRNTILQTFSGHPIVATTAALLLPPNPTTHYPNSSSSKATETE